MVRWKLKLRIHTSRTQCIFLHHIYEGLYSFLTCLSDHTAHIPIVQET